MPENPSPVLPEKAPVEKATSRKEVMDSFNKAAFRWEVKISTLHNQINPYVEIDKLKGTDSHTPGQEREVNDADLQKFATFRTFTQGIRGLNASPHPILIDSQPSDTLTASFMNAQTGEVIHRQEGPDISGLIESAKEDVRLIQEQLAQSANSPLRRSQLEEQLQAYQKDVQNLEENSVPYLEEFPDALNEANPVEKGRIREEARRVWDYSLTRKPTMEEDWAAAKDRLKNARLLKIPPKEESQPPLREEPLPEAKEEGPFAYAPEDLPPPVATNPSTSSVKPYRQDTYPEPTTFPLAYQEKADASPLLPPYSPASSPLRGMKASLPFIETPPVGIFPPTPYEPSPTFPTATSKPEIHKEYDDNNLGDIYRKVVSDLKNFIKKNADKNDESTVEDIKYRIRNWSEILGKETRRYDPVISEKVEELKKVKIPDRHRVGLGILLLPVAAVLLALCNPADTKGVPKPSEPSSGGAASAPAPAFEPRKGNPPVPLAVPMPEPKYPLPTEFRQAREKYDKGVPNSFKEFEYGYGWANLKYGKADFPLRSDYEQKLDLANPNRNFDNIEGYSLKGFVEAELAKVINPNLARRVAQLEANKQNLPETDDELNKTVQLMREKIDAIFGPGAYDSMVFNFSERMRNAIHNYNSFEINPEIGRKGNIIYSQERDKIIQGDFFKWLIQPEDIDTWFRLKYGGRGDIDAAEWRKIADDIAKQAQQKEKNE